MTTIDSRVPIRTCIGCRTRRPATELVRVTRNSPPEVGGVVVDGPSSGRGAWVCRGDGGDIAEECVEQGLRAGGFARAWRIRLDARLEEAIRALTDGEGMTTGKG